MNGRLAAWWRLRTLREQRLLLVMVALIAVLLAWLLVVRPLADALDRARSDHAEAVTDLAEAGLRAAARQPPSRTTVPPLPVDAFVTRTASEAGFAAARVTAQGPSGASVAIDAARPQAFFAWVGQMEQSGLTVHSLQARTNADRTLAIEVVLRARPR